MRTVGAVSGFTAPTAGGVGQPPRQKQRSVDWVMSDECRSCWTLTRWVSPSAGIAPSQHAPVPAVHEPLQRRRAL